MKIISIPILVLILLACSSLATAQGIGEILVNVTTEKETTGFAQELKAEDFRVKIGKTFQKITSFQLKDEPISVGILIDISGSIGRENQSKNGLNLFVEGVKQFVNSGSDGNEYFVTGFNTKPYPVVDKTQSRDAVLHGLETLQSAKTYGNTSFYDALKFGIEKISAAKHRKKALLVISDGTDNSSASSFDAVNQALKASDVLLYSVSFNQGRLSDIQGFAFLDRLTALSGGKSFYIKKPDEINTTFESISTELRSQYMIGFVPDKQKSGKWNKIKIEVKVPENTSEQTEKIVVRCREGFIYQ